MPELHVEAPRNLDDVMMSQARSVANQLLGLLLPEMDDRRRNFRPRINVRHVRELILLVERVMHVPGEDGVLVLSMVSTMNAMQVMPTVL
jgi:hypothetical protein